MEIEKAIEILHPDTTFKAITEIEYYGGFKGKEKAMEAINEACVVACECMEKQIPKKIVINNIPKTTWTKATIKYSCPCCDRVIGFNELNYCSVCGQKIDWGLDD